MEEEFKRKKLRIGVDLDDTILNTIDNFIVFCRGKGLDLAPENMTSYYCWEKDGLNESSISELFFEFNSHCLGKDIDFIKESKKVLQTFKENYSLFLITSRPVKSIEFTKEFLIDNFGDDFFEEIIHSGKAHLEGKCKHEICKDLNIDILIDDRKKYAINCANAGIRVLLVDKPWNQNCPEHENIVRVKDWDEILEKIEEIANAIHREN